MKLRFNYRQANPAAFDLMMQLEKFMQSSGIDKRLYELIKLRASQINGCSFCIDMHAKDLLTIEEPVERIMLLPVWREVPIYTDKERSVLELTEAVTRISDAGVPEQVFEQVRAHFEEKEIVAL